MYKLVSSISAILRAFIFPNPFTPIFELYLEGTVLSSIASILSELFNLVIGGTILYVICYSLVGIIYKRGESPTLGSILYAIFMLINSKLLVWVSQWGNGIDLNSLLIRFSIVLVIEIIILFGIRYIKELFI